RATTTTTRPRPCSRRSAGRCDRPSASRGTWCRRPRGCCDGVRCFPSPLEGEGGRRRRSDEGCAGFALLRRVRGHSPLIRLATRATFSPEGRRAMNVTLIGYGAGNVASVRFALERLGARVRISGGPADLDEVE